MTEEEATQKINIVFLSIGEFSHRTNIRTLPSQKKAWKNGGRLG